MATYKAIAKGFCGIKEREIGDQFSYDGEPGSWMKPMDKEAEEAVKALTAKKTKGKDKDKEVV